MIKKNVITIISLIFFFCNDSQKKEKQIREKRRLCYLTSLVFNKDNQSNNPQNLNIKDKDIFFCEIFADEQRK